MSSTSHKTPRPPKNIFDHPIEYTKPEWIRMNTADFLNFYTLIYHGEVGSECSCSKMTAGPSYEFLWGEDEYKNNPSSLPARDYIHKVKQWAEKLIDGFGPFTPEVTPPDNFQRTCVQIWSRVLRVMMHIYWHHWECIVMRDTDVLLNNYTKHFIVFALKHKLIVRFDSVAPIFDLLGTILPPNYHKQLQDMQKKVKSSASEKEKGKDREREKERVPSKRSKDRLRGKDKLAGGRIKRGALGKGALNKLKAQQPEADWTGDDFDFEDEANGKDEASKEQEEERQERERKEKEEQERLEKEKAEEEERNREREREREKEKEREEEEERERKSKEGEATKKRAPTVVQIPLELLNSFIEDPTLPSPTVYVRRGSDRSLPSLPPTFNPEAALNRLYEKEETIEGDDDDENDDDDDEDEEGNENGGENREGKEGGLPQQKRGKSKPFRRSRYLTQEEMEEFMRLKEDERREWVKRKQQLPNTLSDNKVRYEHMLKESKNK